MTNERGLNRWRYTISDRRASRARLLIWSCTLGLSLGLFDAGAPQHGARPEWTAGGFPTLLPPARAQNAADEDDDQERFVVIKAGKIIPIEGQEIENGLVIIANGQIRQIGRGIEYPLNAKVIDARDLVVMPGLIHANTRYGMPAYNRSGVHGDLTVADEFHPTERQFEDLLEAGFTAVALAPPGRDIPGRALVVRTAGDESVRELVSPAYLKIAARKKVLRDALKKAEAEIEKVEKARKAHKEKLKKQAQDAKKKQEAEKKKADEKKPAEGGDKKDAKKPPASQPTTKPTSQPAFEPPKIDPAYQPLVDLIQKKEGVRALVELSNASSYVHIAEVLEDYEIAYDWRIRNGRQPDFDRVLDQISEPKPRVVLWAQRHRVPSSAERLPLVRMFDEAECEVSLIPRRDTRSELLAYLPRVAELVREGWPRERALAALTLHPARLLGIDARFGSIEKDKDADLILLDADPFAPGARVRKVMIAGRIVHTVDYDQE